MRKSYRIPYVKIVLFADEDCLTASDTVAEEALIKDSQSDGLFKGGIFQ